jgi:hypothetical protein
MYQFRHTFCENQDTPYNKTFSLQQGTLMIHSLNFDILKIGGDNGNKMPIAKLL